jgi:hypothetical protein
MDAPAQLGFTPAVCVMTGVAGTALTVCVQLPGALLLLQPAFVTLTVYVTVVVGETVIARVVAPVDQR